MFVRSVSVCGSAVVEVVVGVDVGVGVGRRMGDILIPMLPPQQRIRFVCVFVKFHVCEGVAVSSGQ